MVNGNFQLIFVLLIHLTKISLQIVHDQIALYLVSKPDWCAQTFPLKKIGFNLILVLHEFIPIMLK